MVKPSQISFGASQQILNWEKHKWSEITSKSLVDEPAIGAKELGWLSRQVGLIMVPAAWGLRPSSAVYLPWASGPCTSLTWTPVFSFREGRWDSSCPLITALCGSEASFPLGQQLHSCLAQGRHSSFQSLASGRSDNSWAHALSANAQLLANGHLSWVVCRGDLTKHNFEEFLVIIGEKVGSCDQGKVEGNASNEGRGNGCTHLIRKRE